MAQYFIWKNFKIMKNMFIILTISGQVLLSYLNVNCEHCRTQMFTYVKITKIRSK